MPSSAPAVTLSYDPAGPQFPIAVYDKLNIASNRRGDPNYVDDVYAQQSF